jgi:hypothetical protein
MDQSNVTGICLEFALTNVPSGGIAPVVFRPQSCRIEIGCQGAECRSSYRDLYCAKANVPVDVVFDDQGGRVVTGKKSSQCVKVTQPG